jgi:Tol biopolymer transport system component
MDRQALAVVSTVLVGLASAVPAAEASFPGRNGLIAFAREGPPFELTPPVLGAQTIWLVDPRSGRTRQLTHIPGRCGRAGFTWDDSEPSFSASGHLVVYTHFDSCDPRTPDGIYAIRSDGSGRRLIWRATSEVQTPVFPALSPSGRLLAFSEDGGPTFMTSFRRPRRERELSLSAERYYLPDQPAWSSTGRLALTLHSFTGHIGTVTAGGKDLRLVTRSTRDAMPDWSPTGDRIVFQRQKEMGRIKADVLTAPARGERQRRPMRLTATRDAFFPVWSPDGRYIAYVRAPDFRSTKGSLWIMRAADGEGQRLVAAGVTADRISWQPRPRRNRR